MRDIPACEGEKHKLTNTFGFRWERLLSELHSRTKELTECVSTGSPNAVSQQIIDDFILARTQKKKKRWTRQHSGFPKQNQNSTQLFPKHQSSETNSMIETSFIAIHVFVVDKQNPNCEENYCGALLTAKRYFSTSTLNLISFSAFMLIKHSH